MDISMNSIDSMTLSYFTNRSQYEQILKRTLNHKDDLEYTKEKRFYKKRILDLNKKLFRNEIDDRSMMNNFDMYIKGCIEYLKMIDTSELMQKQYQDSSNNGTNSIDLDTCTDVSNILLSGEDFIHYDNLMTNNDSTKKVNLDTYVVKTSTSKKQEIFPKKQHVNIKTRQHKTKGIKPKGEKIQNNELKCVEKKKNITNNYNYNEDTKE
jgi:hypothetical protein|tara:strand:+ start:554 stop:1180 length:627 start_codon:yes stop_codon:yes gene_type:complete